MKTIILILFSLNLCTGQQIDLVLGTGKIYLDSDTQYQIQNDTFKIDTAANKICLERGHISSGFGSSTAMYCESYTIDTDSTSTIIYPACNWIEYTCQRCKKSISEREKERRIVIWRKK